MINVFKKLDEETFRQSLNTFFNVDKLNKSGEYRKLEEVNKTIEEMMNLKRETSTTLKSADFKTGNLSTLSLARLKGRFEKLGIQINALNDTVKDAKPLNVSIPGPSSNFLNKTAKNIDARKILKKLT